MADTSFHGKEPGQSELDEHEITFLGTACGTSSGSCRTPARCVPPKRVAGWKSVQRRFNQMFHTVCPGSSDPPEKIFNIFASENEVYTIY